MARLRNRQTLFNEQSGRGVDPLIDVVMNGFAAMFIIVVVLLVLKGHEPIQFLKKFQLPPAFPGESFTFTFPVQGGQGRRIFRLLEGDLSSINLEFDRESGTIFGQARLPGNQSTPMKIPLRLQVVDEAGHTDQIETDLELWEMKLPVRDLPSVGLSRQTAALPPARKGVGYETVLGITHPTSDFVASLEDPDALPDGLVFDAHRVAIQGVPKESGEFRLKISIHQQPGSFVTALGHPVSWEGSREEREYILSVSDVAILRPLLPLARVGQEYVGAILSGPRLAGELIRVEGLAESGLKFDPETGAVSGIPIKEGSLEVRYFLENAEAVPMNATLAVLPAVPEPQVGPLTAQAWVNENTAIAIPYRGFMEPVEVTGTNLPPGLRLEGAAIVGKPTQPGLHTVQVTLEDCQGRTGNSQLRLRVGPSRAPIQSPALTHLYLPPGQKVDWRPLVVGGEAPFEWRFSDDTSIDRDGYWRASVSKPGTSRKTFVVVDPVTKESVPSELVIHCAYPETSRPQFVVPNRMTAAIGQPFEYSPKIEGGVGIPRITLVSEVPPGLRFEDGRLHGTVTGKGAWPLVFQAMTVDLEEPIESSEITLQASHHDSSKLQIATQSIPIAVEGKRYEFQFAATGGVGVPDITFIGRAPPGMRFTENSLVGIASLASSRSTFQVQATDDAGQKARASIEFRVQPLASNPRPKPVFENWMYGGNREMLAWKMWGDDETTILVFPTKPLSDTVRDAMQFLGSNSFDCQIQVVLPTKSLVKPR